jgi:hypothetical protein
MNNQLGEVVPIGELKVPNVLYKYRYFGNEYHEKAIFENELYIPSANEFNDPFDSRIPFRYREEDLTTENIYLKGLELAPIRYPNNPERHQEFAFEMQKKGLLNDPYHLEKFDQDTFEKLCNSYGIYCLTPNAEDMLMWSYYGNSHKGFCIGYNTKYLIECGLFGMGGQVLYQDDFPRLPLLRNEEDNPMLKILFTKWTKWSHENEYRLIHRYKHGKIHKLDNEAISEIVFGCQVSEKDRLVYEEKISKHLPKTKVFQIELRKDNFGLSKSTIVDELLLFRTK